MEDMRANEQMNKWLELANEQDEDTTGWDKEAILKWAINEVDYAIITEEWHGITQEMTEWVNDNR